MLLVLKCLKWCLAVTHDKHGTGIIDKSKIKISFVCCQQTFFVLFAHQIRTGGVTAQQTKKEKCRMFGCFFNCSRKKFKAIKMAEVLGLVHESTENSRIYCLK